MSDALKNTMNILKILHVLGLLMVIVGIALHSMTQMSLQVSGMLIVACLIGIGGVLMSPFPIVLFMQWARKQP